LLGSAVFFVAVGTGDTFRNSRKDSFDSYINLKSA
jgi:hypothetical protein